MTLLVFFLLTFRTEQQSSASEERSSRWATGQVEHFQIKWGQSYDMDEMFVHAISAKLWAKLAVKQGSTDGVLF